MHPLILKLAQKGIYERCSRRRKGCEFLRTQLRDADEIATWQWVTAEIYVKGFNHSTFANEERIHTFAIESKFSCKVPNVFTAHLGQYNRQLGIAATGLALLV